jgi:hypothetical protein
MEVTGQHFTLLLYSEERSSVLIEKEAGWTPEQVWIFEKEINFFPLPEFELRILQSVA